MKTVALYGDMTVDRIYRLGKNRFETGIHNEYFTSDRRYGGIFNVKRAIEKQFPSIGVALNFNHLFEVDIIVDDYRKTSLGKWPFAKSLRPIAADWHHIAYLDKQRWVDTGFLHALKGKVSVDLADELVHPDTMIELAPFIDYWFMNINNPTIRNIDKLLECIRGYVITHSRSNAVIRGKKSHEIVDSEQKKTRWGDADHFQDVVGAGDYFAAGFIGRALFQPKLKPRELLVAAHSCSKEMLKAQNV